MWIDFKNDVSMDLTNLIPVISSLLYELQVLHSFNFY